MKSHDELVVLYQNDPEGFEIYCRGEINAAIDKMIATSTDEDAIRRIKAMQWRIDMELRKYKDPIARMNKMIELFWEGVNKFSEVLSGKD